MILSCITWKPWNSLSLTRKTRLTGLFLLFCLPILTILRSDFDYFTFWLWLFCSLILTCWAPEIMLFAPETMMFSGFFASCFCLWLLYLADIMRDTGKAEKSHFFRQKTVPSPWNAGIRQESRIKLYHPLTLSCPAWYFLIQPMPAAQGQQEFFSSRQQRQQRQQTTCWLLSPFSPLSLDYYCILAQSRFFMPIMPGYRVIIWRNLGFLCRLCQIIELLFGAISIFSITLRKKDIRNHLHRRFI